MAAGARLSQGPSRCRHSSSLSTGHACGRPGCIFIHHSSGLKRSHLPRIARRFLRDVPATEPPPAIRRVPPQPSLSLVLRCAISAACQARGYRGMSLTSSWYQSLPVRKCSRDPPADDLGTRHERLPVRKHDPVFTAQAGAAGVELGDVEPVMVGPVAAEQRDTGSPPPPGRWRLRCRCASRSRCYRGCARPGNRSNSRPRCSCHRR